LRFERTDFGRGKSSHKVCGDLSRIGLENVFQRAATLGPRLGQLLRNSRFGFLETFTITIIIRRAAAKTKNRSAP
jgi:hypothetical protein